MKDYKIEINEIEDIYEEKKKSKKFAKEYKKKIKNNTVGKLENEIDIQFKKTQKHFNNDTLKKEFKKLLKLNPDPEILYKLTEKNKNEEEEDE